MDEQLKSLQGSESRDIFKRCHKQLSRTLYATDADLCLVSKSPPGTVAYLDYKKRNDSVTFTEVIQYNEWMRLAPVYIVSGDDPESGPFTIYRYLGGDWKPHPPTVHLEQERHCLSWQEFEDWEIDVRRQYHKRNGWNGNLKTTYQNRSKT